MEEEKVTPDTSVEEETVELEVISEETTEEPTDNVETLKEELEKAKEYGKNQKIRAEKAEKKAKDVEPPKEDPEPSKDDSLSQTDVISIVRSNIDDDDIPYVQKFANMEGISVTEALKSDDLKELLSNRSEKRKVASATNVDTARATSHKVSDETLIANAEKGKLPDSDKDMVRLVKARKGIK